MIVRIEPSSARGQLKAPPSKSMAHRMLICAGLSQGHSIVSGIEPSEDVLATIDCLKALGAKCFYDRQTVDIYGADTGNLPADAELCCRECGSTLRFFVPICLLSGRDMTLRGSEKLMSRPMSVYEDLCREKGFGYHSTGTGLHIKGKLTGGDYRIPGNISSQFVSGLLFALPLCQGDSRIRLIPPVESRPYIDMTLEALRLFGIKAGWVSDTELSVQGNQHYVPCSTEVEGDWSNAAVFEALSFLGNDIEITGLNPDSLQGDRICKDYLNRLRQENCRIDIADCPDLGPVLIAAAALMHGAHLTGTRRLSMKESDRGMAMKEELEKFGCEVIVQENDIFVPESSLHRPTDIPDSHNDHRIAMALAVLETVTGGEISTAEAVKKSFPDFYDRLKMLGMEVYKNGMDQ